jgi:hypothetical protein
VCAAALGLVFQGGCAPDYFSLSYWQRGPSGQQAASFSGTASSESTLRGSVTNVSLLCQSFLGVNGLEVQFQQDSEGIRINSATKAGKRFSLLLTKDATSMGDEHTHIRIEWLDGADESLWTDLQLFAAKAPTR